MFVYYEELIHDHKKYWTCDKENRVGYNKKFVGFVDSVIQGREHE